MIAARVLCGAMSYFYTYSGSTPITGGNFRLLNRLLTQMERILEINALQQVTKTVIEAARESLVIGQT